MHLHGEDLTHEIKKCTNMYFNILQVHLLQQGEDLNAQMKELCESVDNFVRNQHMDPIPQSHTMFQKQSPDIIQMSLNGEDFPSTEQCVRSGYDSGYNTSQLPSAKDHRLQRETQRYSTNQSQSMSRQLSSGSRSNTTVGDLGEDIPLGSAPDSLDSHLLCCGKELQNCHADLPGYCPKLHSGVSSELLQSLPSCSCYNHQDISPVTVSSGYSSDKDSCVREEDIDDLLSPCTPQCASALNEDTISCCDSELVRIYESCKELGHPLSDNVQDNVVSEKLDRENNDTYEDLSHQEFKPINYESLCQKQKESIDISSLQKDCITYTPLFSQNGCNEGVADAKCRSDSKLVKKKFLRRHHSMFEKNSKPYICVAQSIDNRGDISPPPVTALPGFHPAWCGSQEDETDVEEAVDERQSEAFGVSSVSAFHPYCSSSSLTRSKSFSLKDCSTMYEVPVSVRKNLAETMVTDHNSNIQHCHCEPVYSLVKSLPKRTLTYSCSSDSGNSSTGYCIDSQSPALSSSDEGIFESPEKSVLYEPIDEDPIYEYVLNTSYSGYRNTQIKDTPPKLPKRNPVSRSHPREKSCDARRRAVKLEDIIKPSDIVDTGGKHLYTVADVLASVQKLAQDMPTCAKETTVTSGPCDKKIQRSTSCVAATLSHKSNAIAEDIKGFKRIFSPKLKARRSTSCKSGKKDSDTVHETMCSDSCLEEKPESVHGLLVIPTHYGLQFKSSVQCTPPPKVRNEVNAGHMTSPTNCSSSAIAWNSLGSSSKEIFC